MKKIKKATLFALAALALSSSLSGCATVFGGRVSEHQKRKPLPGEQQRQLRVGAFIADLVLFWPGLAIDFATGAIYKPQPKATAAQAKPAAGVAKGGK